MLIYDLNFLIEEGKTDTFLLGSKSLFPGIESVLDLFSKSIDVRIHCDFYMTELERGRIHYRLKLDIDYPKQELLWGGYSRDQIDNWFRAGVDIALGNNGPVDYKLVVKKLELDRNFIYIKISEKKLQNNLADLKKLSILLFKNLYYFENKDDQK